MRIYDYVTPDRVLIGLDATDAASALHAMTAPLASGGAAASADELFDALLMREQAHTTALDCGVAAPHATMPGVHEPVMLIATARRPVAFGPEGSPPVRLFFLLLSPPSQAGLHIRLLARIARLVRREGFVDQLVNARTRDELLARLASAEPQVA
jgi:mannitol/fructose-specific phosphotransferase system IIA component (Ntr-type)